MDLKDISRTITEFLSKWKFDPLSAVATLIVLPVILALLKAIGKSIKQWALYAVNGALYWLSRSVLRSLSAQLSLRKYCSLQLAAENRFLYVP